MTMMTIPSSIKTLFNTFPLVVLPPLAHPPVEIQFGRPNGKTGETLVGEGNGSRLYVLRNDPISLATHLYYTWRGVSHTVIYTTRDSHSSHPFMIRMTTQHEPSLSDPVSAILNESRTDDTTKAFCSLFEGPIKTAYDSTTTSIWSDTFEDGWMAELEDAKIAWEAVNTYLASKTNSSTTGSETWADAMMFGYAHMILSTTSTDSGRRQVEMKRVVEKQTRIVTWRNAMLKSTNLDMI